MPSDEPFLPVCVEDRGLKIKASSLIGEKLTKSLFNALLTSTRYEIEPALAYRNFSTARGLTPFLVEDLYLSLKV